MEVHRLWEGDVGPIRAREMRRHLTQCPLCRAEVESWDRLSVLMARGDPAQPLVPERRQLMKDALLERCAQSSQKAGDPAGRRSVPVLASWRWRLRLNLALALAPL